MGKGQKLYSKAKQIVEPNTQQSSISDNIKNAKEIVNSIR